MSIPLTIQAVTSLYLYGTEAPSADIESRLRPDDTPDLQGNVDVAGFMATVGRFASPLQTDVVSKFLNGSLDLLANTTPDANGVRSISFAQAIAAGLADFDDGTVAISQYTTGTGEADWAVRAFVWGSTAFQLSATTLFVDDGTTREVHGGAMRPFDDNFDLNTDNTLAQLYNDTRLVPALDPYGIGHKVMFNFAEADKDAYSAAHASDVYRPADLVTTFPGVDFLPGVSSLVGLGATVVDAILGDATVMQGIEEGAQYITNGHNVIFGNGQANALDASSLRGTFSDASLPNYFVAGDGMDSVDTSSTIDGDVVFGGKGADAIRVYGNGHDVHGGADGDDVEVWGDWATVATNEGNDTIAIFGQGAIVDAGADDDTVSVTGTESIIVTGTGQDRVILDDLNTRHGVDYFLDATSDDSISVGINGSDLTGGAKTLTSIFHYNYEGADHYDHFYGAAEQDAFYERFGADDENLRVWGNNASRLVISNFSDGDAGLAVGSYEHEDTGTKGSTYGARFLTDNDGHQFYAGFGQVPVLGDFGFPF